MCKNEIFLIELELFVKQVQDEIPKKKWKTTIESVTVKNKFCGFVFVDFEVEMEWISEKLCDELLAFIDLCLPTRTQHAMMMRSYPSFL